ncbi:hypothetical protein [Amedibacillus sp. YH-ame10]
MNIKNDDVLCCLRSFGFSCEEKTMEGFLRYQKRIGDLLVTVANGQFENKIRISMLQDGEGRIRTSYKDIMVFMDMLKDMMIAGLIEEGAVVSTMNPYIEGSIVEDFEDMDNPLLGLPRKPEGFMAQ